MRYSTLRKSLLISLCLGALAILTHCKGTARNNESKEPAAVSKNASDAGLADTAEADTETVEELKEKSTIPAVDSSKQVPPPHNAPNQTEIDSLKKHKTRAKNQSGK